MKLDNSVKIEKVCSKDKTRASISQPYFDRDAGKLIATNGAAMAIVPVEVEDTDTAGYVPIQAIVAARKAKSGIELNGSARVPAAGLTLDRLDMQFPDWKRILNSIESNDEEIYTICLNAELLAQLAAAIGSEIVTLQIPKSGLSPIKVKTRADSLNVGILGPCRPR